MEFWGERKWLVWPFGIVLVIGLFAGFGYMIDSATSDTGDGQSQAFAKAMRICGSAPRTITTHGSSWSFGPWIEVTCRDGSKRAVQL